MRLTEHWNESPREVVESLSLETDIQNLSECGPGQKALGASA